MASRWRCSRSRALADAAPESLDGALSVASVIEEECGGNGALAAFLAGAIADGVLLPEPTNLTLLLGGVGVVWCEITVHRTGSHAGQPGGQGSALDAALEIAERLRALTHAFEDGDADMRDPAEQYLFNIGTLQAGEWISNAPSVATLGVRVGYPTRLTPAEAQEHVRATVAAADPGADAALRRVPGRGLPRRRRTTPSPSPIARAHRDDAWRARRRAHPARPPTTRASTPAVASRPSVTARHGRNLHAVDEAVEIASIAEGARTLTRLIPHWLHGDDA